MESEPITCAHSSNDQSNEPTADDIGWGAHRGTVGKGTGLCDFAAAAAVVAAYSIICWRWPPSLSSFCIVWRCLMWLQRHQLQLWYVMVRYGGAR